MVSWNQTQFEQWIHEDCPTTMVSELTLSSPTLETVKNIYRLSDLVLLTIYGGCIPTTFPPNIKVLNIINVDLGIFPEQIYNLEHLIFLYIINCGIHTISSEIGRLSNVEILSLQDNSIDNIPQELWSLCRLEQLDLSRNQRVIIPEGVRGLRNLKRLILLDIPEMSIHLSIRDLPLRFFEINNIRRFHPLIRAFYYRIERQGNIGLRYNFDYECIPEDISITNECSVCGESYRLLICGCRHVICINCINSLCTNTCPVCRKEIIADLIKRKLS